MLAAFFCMDFIFFAAVSVGSPSSTNAMARFALRVRSLSLARFFNASASPLTSDTRPAGTARITSERLEPVVRSMLASISSSPSSSRSSCGSRSVSSLDSSSSPR
uniref:Putative secreted protein n=1 Tax=Anopheles darlingi TaxID=43151 RepID=A0A2M4D9S4_ANODA